MFKLPHGLLNSFTMLWKKGIMWSIPNSDTLHKSKDEAPGRIIHACIYIISAEYFSHIISAKIFCLMFLSACNTLLCAILLTPQDRWYVCFISVSFNLQICVFYHLCFYISIFIVLCMLWWYLVHMTSQNFNKDVYIYIYSWCPRY